MSPVIGVLEDHWFEHRQRRQCVIGAKRQEQGGEHHRELLLPCGAYCTHHDILVMLFFAIRRCCFAVLGSAFCILVDQRMR